MSRVEKSPMITISNGLLDPRHVAAMGSAIWEYFVLLDRQTSPNGTVNGGVPIQAAQLAKRTGHSTDTVRRALLRLRDGGYIDLKRAPYGFIVRIEKPKKLFRRVGKSAKSGVGKNAESDGGESSQKCGRESAEMPNVIKTIANKAIFASPKRGSTKTVLDPDRCSHDPRCKSLPWHITAIIAESADVEPVFSAKELGQAKALADVPDDEIRGTVAYMIETNGEWWGRKMRILPANVADQLPLWQKHSRGRVNGRALTEAQLAEYADRREATA